MDTVALTDAEILTSPKSFGFDRYAAAAERTVAKLESSRRATKRVAFSYPAGSEARAEMIGYAREIADTISTINGKKMALFVLSCEGAGDDN